jgi:hypothetical protein
LFYYGVIAAHVKSVWRANTSKSNEAEMMVHRMGLLLLMVLWTFTPAESRGDYPADPSADTSWPYSAESRVTDIQSRFNTARANENSQLGSAIPMLALPDQSDWDAKSPGEKALWLINRERVDRGIDPLYGLEPHVAQVAQDYARYLLAHDAFAHDADGQSPRDRLNNDPAIDACHDFLGVAENLSVLWGGWTLPIERAVYMWIYDDSDSHWGHRHAVLWYPYNDNSGAQGVEGFLGIGLATGEHQGWSDSDIIVMNVFDPCATWAYSGSDVELSVTLDGAAGGWVRSTPAGIECGQDCSHLFAPGQVVTLTAETDACTEFTGWSGGGCSGDQACVVTLNGDTTVVAGFAALDTDSNPVPDCGDPGSDPPDDPQDGGDADGGSTGDGSAGQGAADGGSGGSGSGCFIHSLRQGLSGSRQPVE